MLWNHFKKMEENGNHLYSTTMQGAIKTRGAMNRKELEMARPWILDEEYCKSDFETYKSFLNDKAIKKAEAKAKEKTKAEAKAKANSEGEK